jgi:hypothetical protein
MGKAPAQAGAEARQIKESFMETNMRTKMIRIIDGHYKLQFLVEDGGYIVADGKKYQLHYLDATHFAVNAPNGRCWHICEFGERVVDKGTDIQKWEEDLA